MNLGTCGEGKKENSMTTCSRGGEETNMPSLIVDKQYTYHNHKHIVIINIRSATHMFSSVILHMKRYFNFNNEGIGFTFVPTILLLPIFLVVFFHSASCSTRCGTLQSPIEPKSKVGNDTDKPSLNDTLETVNIVKSTTKASEVGEALEKRDYNLASDLAAKLQNFPADLLVKARLAEALQDYETAVSVYHQMTDILAEFEPIRITAIAESLYKAGRPDEAASQLELFLRSNTVVPESDRFAMNLKRARWNLELEKHEEALQILEDAKRNASNAIAKDKLSCMTAEIFLAQGKKQPAATILNDILHKPSSKETLLKTLSLLKKHQIKLKISDSTRITTAKKLIEYKAFDLAEEFLNQITLSTLQNETEWLKAKTLFDKRRHYKEAFTALSEIAKQNSPYADEAAFLAARALSRLDRDEEAIVAFRAYASKTKRKAKAAEARFTAARLEFYLGRNKQALASFERLVGRGLGGKNQSRLGPSNTRDAHFMAGLSAYALKRYDSADSHFNAASTGTSDFEVLARNKYWSAATKAAAKKPGWQQALYQICNDDYTDWYARMAAMRLEDEHQPLESCDLSVSGSGGLSSSEEFDGGVGPTVNNTSINNAPIIPLSDISPLAALYAEAGLLQDAADFLRKVEISGKTKMPTEHWISHYTALNAPQYAISKATFQLKRPFASQRRDIVEAAYPTPYKELVAEVERSHGLPEKLIFAIARKESLFNPNVVSRAGAMGLMQMMPQTFEKNRKKAGLPSLEPGTLPGPEDSLRAAGYEFASLFSQFKTLPLAIMAYNGGSAAVSRWLDRSGGEPLDVFVEKAGFAETRNYVRRVTKNLIRYRLLYGGPKLDMPRVVEKPNYEKPN